MATWPWSARPERLAVGRRRARATRPSGSRCPRGTARAAPAPVGAAAGRVALASGPRSAAKSTQRDHRRPAARRARARRRRAGTAPTARCTHGVAPAGRPEHPVPASGRRSRSGSRPARVGREVREQPVGQLLGGEVAQPLRREPGDVVEERGGRDEHLPVAGPARALPVRAVGRDVAGVAAEAPVGDRRGSG